LWRAYTTVPATITLRTWNQYKNQHTYQLVHFNKSDKYEHINTRHYVSPTPRPDRTINIDLKKRISFTVHQPSIMKTTNSSVGHDCKKGTFDAFISRIAIHEISKLSNNIATNIAAVAMQLTTRLQTTADSCCTADHAPLTLHHWPCTRWPHHPLSIIHWPLHRSAASSPSPPHGVLTHRGYYR